MRCSKPALAAVTGLALALAWSPGLTQAHLAQSQLSDSVGVQVVPVRGPSQATVHASDPARVLENSWISAWTHGAADDSTLASSTSMWASLLLVGVFGVLVWLMMQRQK